MKYLFFDIECSDGKHICSFGYVLTDDNFKIIEKEDILINPEAIFHTGAWSKSKREKNVRDRGIDLAYPKEKFLASPKFPHYYERIKGLLTARGVMVIGFSCDNDARFIMRATEKYKLPYINYTICDIQRAYREYKEVCDQPALEKVLEDLGVSVADHVAHRSDEDAEVTMLVAKAMCKRLDIDLKELIEKYPACQGEVEGSAINFKHVKGSVCEGGRYRGSNSLRKYYKTFVAHARNTKPKAGAKLPLKGQRLCLSTVYEDKHFCEMMVIVERIGELGGKYVTRASEATIYGEYTVGDKTCRRRKVIEDRLAKGKNLTKKSFKDFISLLGWDQATLDKKAQEYKQSIMNKAIE